MGTIQALSYSVLESLPTEAGTLKPESIEKALSIGLTYMCSAYLKVRRPLHPLNTSKWDFYVLPTKVLDQKCPEQKTIRLSSLEKLLPRKCNYAGLKKAISDVEREIKL